MTTSLSGTWLLDTNILVAFFDASSAHHEAAKTLLSDLNEGKFQGVIASQNILELSAVLIGGYRTTKQKVASDIQTLISFSNISTIYPITATVTQYLKLLKKEQGVHAADLFLSATMISNGITSIVTNDRDFEKISELTFYNPFSG